MIKINNKKEKKINLEKKTELQNNTEKTITNDVDPMHKVFSGAKLSSTLNKSDPNIVPKPGFFNKIFAWSMRHFFITFIILYLTITFSVISKHGIVSLLAGMILATYTIIYLSRTVRINTYKFMHNQLRIKQILVGYVSTILSLIGLFAIIYWGIAGTGVGYVKYGSCNANNIVTPEIISADPGAVNDALNYVYYSAMTFLTVGFGDICPMGISKIFTIIEGLVGNIFTLLILAIAISNYNASRNNKEDIQK